MLNTRSLTEAELVGVNDMMAMILWTRNFSECQGYDVTDNILYQDNESAMLLGKMGSGRLTSAQGTSRFGIFSLRTTLNVAS